MTTPVTTNRGLLLKSLLQQGSQPPSLVFGKDSGAGRGEGKFYSEKREGFSVFWLKAVLLGRLGADQLGAGCPRGLGAYLAFSRWSWVGREGKNERSWHHWPSPAWLDWLLISLWFGLPGWMVKWYSWSGHWLFIYSVSHVIQVSADPLFWLCLHLDVVKTGGASQQPAPLLCTNSRGPPWPWTFSLLRLTVDLQLPDYHNTDLVLPGGAMASFSEFP